LSLPSLLMSKRDFSVHDTTFRRVRTLQPDVNDEYFNDDAQLVNDRQVLNDLRMAIACWEPPKNQFSAFFLDEFTLQSVIRQIVTAVLVKTQKVHCKIIHDTIPFDGSQLFDKPVPSNLQSLREAEIDLTFPPTPLEVKRPLYAGEFLSICDDCGGSGAIECLTCSGVGTKTCASCAGVGQRACNLCNGAGEVLVSATTTQRCMACNGKGTRNCGSCDGKGNVNCDAVGCSNGNLECVSCASSGKLRNRTFLLIETFVKVGHHLYSKPGWIDPTSELATDLMILRSETVTGSARGVTVEKLRSVYPENLRQDAVRIIRAVAEEKTNSSWDLGTSYELRAGYVYHVVADHLNENSELIVSGCSNSVTVLKAPKQSKSLFKKVGRGIVGLLSGDQVKNSAHVKDVRAGKVFLSDEALIGPALRRLGLEVSLNPDGYDVVLPNSPKGFDRVSINFIFDVAGNITLHCSVPLGEADRDCFPEALMLCNKLPVGQIALQELNNGTVERFVLVHCQPYATTSTLHLSHLLRRLLSTAFQIRKSKYLGLSL
jgi:hypothetical protein